MTNFPDKCPDNKTDVSPFPKILGILPNEIIDSLATRLGALAVISAVTKEVDTIGISMFALYLVGFFVLLIIYPGLFRCMDITINCEYNKNNPKKIKSYILQAGLIAMMVAAPIIYIPSLHKVADLVTTPLGSLIFTLLVFGAVWIAWVSHKKENHAVTIDTTGPDTEI